MVCVSKSPENLPYQRPEVFLICDVVVALVLAVVGGVRAAGA
jgi:hypothetical protein